VRWETERSFDGKLCLEYSYQKLSKCGNWFLSYSRKCFLGHSVQTILQHQNSGGLERSASVRHVSWLFSTI